MTANGNEDTRDVVSSFEGGTGGGGERRYHSVQFYEDDEALCDTVVDFIGPGLTAGEALILVATEAHLALFDERLASMGFDVERARASGQLKRLDAHETLEKLLVDAMPDRQAFEHLLTTALEAGARWGHVRVYGEMVDVLWQNGKTEAALALEAMWNELQERYDFSLLCAYDSAGFSAYGNGLSRVCAAHDHIHSPEEKMLDAALRSSLRELKTRDAERETHARRTEQFMAITAAIADAVTTEEVFCAVVDRVAAALSATSAGLFLVCDESDTVELVRSVGFSDVARAAIQSVALHAEPSLPAQDAIRRDEPVWFDSQQDVVERYPHLASAVTPDRAYAAAALPLSVQGRTLGALGVVFDDSPPIDEEQRNFLMLVARYSGQAIERLRLLEAEKRSRERAEATAAREAFLSQASHAFSEASADLQTLLQTISERVTLEHADACAIMLISDSSDTLDLAAVHHRDPVMVGTLRALLAVSPVELGEGISQPLLHMSEPSQNLMVVPLRARGKVIGTLNAMRDPKSPPFSADHAVLLEALAERAGMAIESSRLFRDSHHARERAELLHGLAREVIAAERVDQVFQAALVALERALGSHRAAVLTIDADGRIRCRVWRGLSSAYRIGLEEYWPWRHDAPAPEPLVVSNIECEPDLETYRARFRKEGIASIAYVPLVASGTVLGAIVVCYSEPRELALSELNMARAISNHVAAAIGRFAAVDGLQQSVRFNEMFTGILGHDLRNPLGAIMTSTHLALKRTEADKLTKPLLRILTSGARMNRMIDQLLDFTRVRVGAGIPIVRRPFDLAPLLRQVMDELDDAYPDWILTLEQAGDARGIWDADRLSQVFSNLVANALQHGTPEHGLRVWIDGQAPDQVMIEIHNMGIIPDTIVPKLFEPMTGGQHRRDKSRGLGLGLYISQEILRAHGGRIDVRSSGEEGTTFTVRLPRSVAGDR